MNELKTHCTVLKEELTKPEVIATLRMATPEVYAHIVAICSLYDAFISRDIEKRDLMTAQMQLQKQMYEQDYYMRQSKVIGSPTNKEWKPR